MNFPRLVQAPQRSAALLEERSDDELMILAQTGVREAFAELVERHAQGLVQTCARFVNDRDTGVDLAQETWVAVWERRALYQAAGEFLPWLITVARNRCRDHLRHHAVAERHAGAMLGPLPTADQIDALLEEERRRRVRAALARLSPAMREALLLRYAEEFRYDQMATALSASESTLRSRVHHGLKLLRSILEKTP